MPVTRQIRQLGWKLSYNRRRRATCSRLWPHILSRKIWLNFSSSTTTMTEAAGTTRPWKYRDKVWFKIGIWVSVLLVLAASVRGIHFVTATSLERTIDQNLGPESDEASVRAFMAAHHILFIGCIAELRRCDGTIHRASISLVFKTHILIEFNFVGIPLKPISIPF